MKPSRQLTTLASLVALVALSGCVWDRGMHGRDRYDDRRDQHGQVPNSYQRDRDGRPCSGPGNHDRDHDGDERHDQDCRPNAH
jgi:hypothetical protein